MLTPGVQIIPVAVISHRPPSPLPASLVVGPTGWPRQVQRQLLPPAALQMNGTRLTAFARV
jgi:hypothetical protein